MPISKQAIKKLRHDKKRTTQRAKLRAALQRAIRDMRKKPSKKALTLAFKKLDKAAKMSLIHSNKASRLKSRLNNLLAKKSS